MRLEHFTGPPRNIPYLRKTWPEAALLLDSGVPLPALDDDEVDAYPGLLPRWCTDKYEVLCRLDRDHFSPTVGDHSIPTPDYSWNKGVIQKPRRNFLGMAIGVKVIGAGVYVPKSDLWQCMFEGRHVSADYAFQEGRILSLVLAHGVPLPPPFVGRFAAWIIEKPLPYLTAMAEELGTETIEELVPNYTGFLNIEYIHDHNEPRIVEVHFRPSLSFGPIYGADYRQGMLDIVLGKRTTALPPPRGGIVVPVPAAEESNILRIDDPKPSWRKSVEYHPY